MNHYQKILVLGMHPYSYQTGNQTGNQTGLFFGTNRDVKKNNNPKTLNKNLFVLLMLFDSVLLFLTTVSLSDCLNQNQVKIQETPTSHCK